MTESNAQSHNGNYSDITSISESEFKEFKKLYHNCKDGDTFKFKDKDVFKDYAKYLIEYLEGAFASHV